MSTKNGLLRTTLFIPSEESWTDSSDRRGLRDRADRPIRGNPFPGRMREDRSEIDNAGASAWVVISTHLPPPVITERTADRAATTHMLCCNCGMYFSAAASSEKAQGSMNLASKTAPLPLMRPSSVAPIQRRTGCRIRRCTSVTTLPVCASYQCRFRSSVATPNRTMRLRDRSSGSATPRFSCQSRTRAASSLPKMIRASEPPIKLRRPTSSSVQTLDFIVYSKYKNTITI